MARTVDTGPRDASEVTLDTRLTTVLGKTAASIERAFGYRTVGEFLLHAPRRYLNHGERTPLAVLREGDEVTVVADVVAAQSRQMRQGRGTLLQVTISDGTSDLQLTFFNQAGRERQLQPGVRGIFSGRVTRYRDQRQLTHPTLQLFDDAAEDALVERWLTRPIPIYPATSTLPSVVLAKSLALTLESLGTVVDPVPEAVRAARGEVPYGDALRLLHLPDDLAQTKAATRSLRFTEAFLLETLLVRRRNEERSHPATVRTPTTGGILERFDAALPFTLTADQRAVGDVVAQDLASGVPMHRLVQGEVGSGKTLVALRAMLTVADSGGQSVLLAPTEVLAAQHLRSIAAILGPDRSAELIPTLVTGQLPTADRRRALLRVAAGQARIVVGTHALLSDRVTFADLGLVVIDEQHRFGVAQREAMRNKGELAPHVLVLTATPIPRTVAMTVFGDLDVSTMRELPSGRAGVSSRVIPLAIRPDWGDAVWQRVAEEVALGRQAFVVCPAIDAAGGDAEGIPEQDNPASPPGEDAAPDEGSSPDASTPPARATVTDTVAFLRAYPLFRDRTVAALHGRMSADEKDAVMRDVTAGRVDVLVATTVIEVGVDVPNASAMVILDADRFGVSQLHQIRGRVGRGSVPGLCILVTHAPPGSDGLQRVEGVAATLDGFALARLDLELRREGDVLGSLQSGRTSSLRLLRAVRDADVIAQARDEAFALLTVDPTLAAHPALRTAVHSLAQASGFLTMS